MQTIKKIRQIDSDVENVPDMLSMKDWITLPHI